MSEIVVIPGEPEEIPKLRRLVDLAQFDLNQLAERIKDKAMEFRQRGLEKEALELEECL